MQRDDENHSGEVARIEALLRQRFGQAAVRVRQFAPDQPVYSVETTSGEQRVVRIGHGLDRYAATLDVLRRVGYPAAHAIADSTGALIGRFDEEDASAGGVDEQDGARSILVLTHVPGSRPVFVPEQLAGIGAALGRLHALGPAAVEAARNPTAGLPILDRAGMLPGNELAFALRCLHAVEDQLPPSQRARWESLVSACESGLDFGAGLTTVFLHGDAHPWNSLIGQDGRAALIDWDSSGPGPAVIDLAFLALSCDTGPLIGPVLPPDRRRLIAVVGAYTDFLQLGPDDLAALEHAVSFRALVGAAVGYAGVTRQGRDPEEDAGVLAGLERVALAPSIADRMRKALGGGRAYA